MLTPEEKAWKFDRRADPFRETWSDVERAVRNAVVTEEIARDMIEWKGVLAWKRKNGVM